MTTPIFDTHCHYNLEPLVDEWQTHWTKAQAAGVNRSVVVGTSLESSQQSIEIAAQESNLLACIGFHPYIYTEFVQAEVDVRESDVVNKVEQDLVALRELAEKARNQQVALHAIGETGLDYFRLAEDDAKLPLIKVAQKLAFKGQLQLAAELNIPTIIHVRDHVEQAYWDVLEVLEEVQTQDQVFILHCVSGPSEYVRRALERGASLGLAGNLTYKNADHLRSLARVAPPERLLLETDAPYLPPQPHRGKTCEPWMISLTGEFLADELGLNLEQMYDNSLKLFNVQD